MESVKLAVCSEFSQGHALYLNENPTYKSRDSYLKILDDPEWFHLALQR